ncbi:hypothetical protein ACQP3F_32285, partial [Escherichia coli]
TLLHQPSENLIQDSWEGRTRASITNGKEARVKPERRNQTFLTGERSGILVPVRIMRLVIIALCFDLVTCGT